MLYPFVWLSFTWSGIVWPRHIWSSPYAWILLYGLGISDLAPNALILLCDQGIPDLVVYDLGLLDLAPIA
jgi:hypothetical protein